MDWNAGQLPHRFGAAAIVFRQLRASGREFQVDVYAKGRFLPTRRSGLSFIDASYSSCPFGNMRTLGCDLGQGLAGSRVDDNRRGDHHDRCTQI